MTININAEEITDRVELVKKVTKDGEFVGIGFYFCLPVSEKTNIAADSPAIVFWGTLRFVELAAKVISLVLADEMGDAGEKLNVKAVNAGQIIYRDYLMKGKQADG